MPKYFERTSKARKYQECRVQKDKYQRIRKLFRNRVADRTQATESKMKNEDILC